MTSQKILSINDLSRVVNSLIKLGKKSIFRGQTVDKPLKPQIARDNSLSVTDEIKIFEEFKKETLPYLSEREEISRPNDDFELLILGQHYRLKTRCLDWTQHAYVALFFAVDYAMNSDTEDGVVWIYDLMPYNPSEWLLPGDRFRKNPFQFREIKIFQPKSFFDFRTDQQGSLVTIHPYPWKPMGGTKDNKRLIKILVPACSKQSIRDQLAKQGINYPALFSKEIEAKKIEDICLAINSKYSQRRVLSACNL